MPGTRPIRTWRFHGRIAGWGTTSGTRCVLGNWHRTPWGSFAGVMVQFPGGERRLLAPSPQVAEFVSATYEFDTIEVTTVQVRRYGSGSPGERSVSPLPPRA